MAGSASQGFSPKFDASMLAADHSEDEDVCEERSNLLNANETKPGDDTASSNGGYLMTYRKKISMCCAGMLVVCAVASSFAIGTSLVNRYHPNSDTDDMQTALAKVAFPDDPPTPSQRLPTNVSPRKYTLHFDVDMVNLNYTGNVVILLDCVAETETIVLHSQQLQITSTSVAVLTEEEEEEHDDSDPNSHAHGMALKVSSVKYNVATSQMIVQLNRHLVAKTLYSLTIDFHNKLSDTRFGFFQTHYTKANGQKRSLAFTMFEPNGARMAYPCLDEPALKATFEVSITHDGSFRAASNMPLKAKSKQMKDNKVTTTFEKTPKMSTYLLSMTVTDYSYRFKTTHSEVKVRAFERADIISQIDFVLEASVKAVNYLETLLILFPLPKLDIFPIPNYGFNGAEEGWGQITFSENLAVYNPKTDLTKSKSDVALVAIHEIAHQYFGDLVSIPWWTDLWLKESLAEYMAVHVVSQLYKEFDVLQILVVEDVNKALHADQLQNTHPISNKVSDVQETSYDSIPYQKGSAFFRMIAVYVGEQNLFNGLQQYLERYKYSIATQDNLWYAIAEAGNKPDLVAMATAWIYQTGYPVVMVTSNPRQPGNLKVSQQRFTISKSLPKETSSVWPLALTIKSDVTATAAMLWLPTQMGQITMPPAKWYKANSDWQGFFRVNYDRANWVELIRQLSLDFNALPPMDRASLLDDSFQLYRAGQVPVDVGLGTYCYLQVENAFAPMFIGLKNLQYLERFPNAKYAQLLRRFTLNGIEPRLKEFGWTPQARYNDERLHTEVLHTAIRLGLHTAVAEGTTHFEALRSANSKDPILGNRLRYEFMKAAVSGGNEANWMWVWSTFLKTTDQNSQLSLLKVLAATSNKALLKRLLSEVLGHTIPFAFQEKVINQVAKNPNGVDLAWDTLATNWDMLYTRHKASPSFTSGCMTIIVKRFTTHDQLAKLQAFISQHPPGLVLRLRRLAIEIVELNIAFHKAEENAIHTWLSDKLLGNSCVPI